MDPRPQRAAWASTTPDVSTVAKERLLGPEEMRWASGVLDRIQESFQRRVIGQESLRRALLIAVLAKGHILLESAPGLAKTLAAHTLALTIGGRFSRVQCTPDLLPSDIVGSQVFDPAKAAFRTELGPIHANLVLLDEINRSSAKTQSAMLEAMQEHQVTIGGQSYRLPNPFTVVATQNPIDDEGTHVLPAAQMDRFLLKEVVPYPGTTEEFDIVERVRRGVFEAPNDPPVCTPEDLRTLQDYSRRVRVDPALVRYAVEIVDASRNASTYLDAKTADYIEQGASPRGSIGLIEAAAAHALIVGRNYVVPDDIIGLRHPVLRHRIRLTFEATALDVSPESVIDALFDVVPAP
ncbi:MoxR family ATPase [Cutibacterium sp. WCA-380-WT-3A]|uniref:MoxR family ATPase n=2 Tax=Cutibacterium porci TaxID=2605781 RepID=A0A7K0J9S1_9ACTN|nr:MoxR family ATPase [Cutibacterium porci]